MDIYKVFNSLLLQNRIFSSEADFQFALAWEIKAVYGDSVNIRLEYIPWKYNDKMHIDIAVFYRKHLISIELKYIKNSLKIKHQGEHIKLKRHTARHIGAYKYLKDIERMEGIINSKEYNIKKAYAIILTNDSGYWRDVRIKKQPIDMAFRIFEGTAISGKREWGKDAGEGTIRNHKDPIVFSGSYTINWQKYKPARDVGFRYTIAEIKKGI